MTIAARLHPSAAGRGSAIAAQFGCPPAATAGRVGKAPSSFRFVGRLLPAKRRRAVEALHALCRELDDIARGTASPSLKLAFLSQWRNEIGLLFTGQPTHTLTRAPIEPVREYDLRCDDFLDFVEGMEMDARRDIRAPSFSEFALYCERVAVAVARLATPILGLGRADARRVADELARAMQITKILRDLAEDGRRHRLYLPREILHRYGILPSMPSAVLAHPMLPQACLDLAVLAEAHYDAAAAAIASCPYWRARWLAAMLGIYRTLLRELIARGWMNLNERVALSPLRKLVIALRFGVGGVPSRRCVGCQKPRP
jgi:phytoene synthase